MITSRKFRGGAFKIFREALVGYARAQRESWEKLHEENKGKP